MMHMKDMNIHICNIFLDVSCLQMHVLRLELFLIKNNFAIGGEIVDCGGFTAVPFLASTHSSIYCPVLP